MMKEKHVPNGLPKFLVYLEGTLCPWISFLKKLIMLTQQGWEENLPTYKCKIPLILEEYV